MGISLEAPCQVPTTHSLDERGYQVNIFLICPRKICCGYSLETPCQGLSNVYPQYTFSWTNKKNIRAHLFKTKDFVS